MPKIALLVVESDEINAYAAKFDDGYTVTLNSSLYHAVNSTFRSLLAHPATFLSVGNFLFESAPRPAKPIGLSAFVEGIASLANRTPVDEQRLAFADHLTELTIRFVIEHELAHILAGHLDYDQNVKSIGDFKSVSEFSEAENFGMEMHADEIAFFQCVFWVFDSLKGIENEWPKKIFIQTLDAQIHDLYVATYMLFQMWSHLSISETHPNPVHRQIRIAVMLQWIARKHELQLINKPHEISAQVINGLNGYMETVFSIDWSDRQEDVAYILQNQMETEIGKYSEMVTSLFPKLKPHSYVKLE